MIDIAWGPEIAVDGKRPEWLGDGEDVKCFTTVWHSGFLIPSGIDWPIIRKIMLRADHPHYATLTHPTAQIPSEVGSEVVGVLVEALAAMIYEATHLSPCKPNGDHDCTIKADTLAEARGALARGRVLLPEPVDADLVEARELEAAAAEANGFGEYARNIRAGEYDDDGPVRCTLNGIRRGRALAAGDR